VVVDSSSQQQTHTALGRVVWGSKAMLAVVHRIMTGQKTNIIIDSKRCKIPGFVRISAISPFVSP